MLLLLLLAPWRCFYMQPVAAHMKPAYCSLCCCCCLQPGCCFARRLLLLAAACCCCLQPVAAAAVCSLALPLHAVCCYLHAALLLLLLAAWRCFCMQPAAACLQSVWLMLLAACADPVCSALLSAAVCCCCCSLLQLLLLADWLCFCMHGCCCMQPACRACCSRCCLQPGAATACILLLFVYSLRAATARSRTLPLYAACCCLLPSDAVLYSLCSCCCLQLPRLCMRPDVVHMQLPACSLGCRCCLQPGAASVNRLLLLPASPCVVAAAVWR